MSATVPLATSSPAKWQPYPAYRYSGVEWLGDIPVHWKVGPLKQFTILVSRGNSPDYVDDSSVAVINQACIHWNGLRLANVKFQREVDVRAWKGRILPGDLLINSTGTGTLGRAAVFGQQGTYIADGHVTIVRTYPNQLSACFLYYLMQTPLYQGYIYSAIVSGATNQVELSREGLRATPIIVPPMHEQHAISAFLDRETARIDALVAKKERLIELLQEKRTALISNVVTKGLDPNVPMKDSGVEWLGEIPVHWDVKRVKHIAVEPLKYGANEPAELDDPDLPRYIRITDINDDGSLRSDTFKSLPQIVARPYMLEAGDLLLARSGATVGKSFMYQEAWRSACYAGYLIRLRVNPLVMLPEFFCYFTASDAYWNWIASVTIQATIQNVSAEKYANLALAVPPLQEQHAIVAFLDSETGKIETLVAKVREHIEKLREYRAALISAAVTGKIDVREEMA